MDPNRLQKLKLDHPPEAASSCRSAPGNGLWRIVVALLLIVVAVLGFFLWRKPGAEQPRVAAKPQSTANVPRQPPGSPTGVFTAAGYLEPIPPYPISVSALVSGRVEEFSILEGTRVKAGDILAKLNATAFENRVAAIEAEQGVAAAKLAQAEAVLARTEKLAAIGSTPARELQRAKADVAVGRAEQGRLQTALRHAKWQLENTVVRSPVDGAVYERVAQVGEFASPDAAEKKGATIVTLFDPVKIQVWVDVTQRDAARVTIGQRTEISLDAEPGKTYVGRVIRIQPRASLQKNTVQVKVSIENPSPMLRPDMSAKVSFFPAENDQANTGKP